MTDRIPEGIEARHILQAIKKIAAGVPNKFAESTGYDVLFEGKRYAPKAVVGVAAGELSGEELGPYDFKGGIGSKCFKVLLNNGFVVVTKGDTDPYPDEVDDEHHEGRSLEVKVNRFERDPEARKNASNTMAHHAKCAAWISKIHTVQLAKGSFMSTTSCHWRA